MGSLIAGIGSVAAGGVLAVVTMFTVTDQAQTDPESLQTSVVDYGQHGGNPHSPKPGNPNPASQNPHHPKPGNPNPSGN